MPGLVYDAGALLAPSVATSRRVAAPAGRPHRRTPDRARAVLAQAWRGGPRPGLSLLLKGCLILPVDEHLARAAGTACGRARTSDVVDALVVVHRRPPRRHHPHQRPRRPAPPRRRHQHQADHPHHLTRSLDVYPASGQLAELGWIMVRSVPVPRVSGALRRASGMSEVSVMALSGAVATPDVQVPRSGGRPAANVGASGGGLVLRHQRRFRFVRFHVG